MSVTPGASAGLAPFQPGPRNLITDVDGIQVGQVSDHSRRTGTSVILCDQAAVGSVDVRGGGPGTRETDLLDPSCLLDQVNAIALSGGSAFGLDAASGVMAWLNEQGRGYQVGPVLVPIVPAAIIFDLINGGDKNWGRYPPYRDYGFDACAQAGKSFELGVVGAGTGALAGNVKGGVGSASMVSADGFQVGAFVVANPVGLPVDGKGRLFSAFYEIGDEMGGQALPNEKLGPDVFLPKLAAAAARMAANTTIGVVATNAALTKAECKRLAIMAHDGLARAIRPLHTPFDGDTIFSLATGSKVLPSERRLPLSLLAHLGADCMTRAVGRALASIDQYPGLPTQPGLRRMLDH